MAAKNKHHNTPKYYTEDDYLKWCRLQAASEVSHETSFVDESEFEALIERFGKEKPLRFSAPNGQPMTFASRLTNASVRAAVMGKAATFFFESQTFACWWEDDILFWIEIEPSLFPY